MNKMNIPWPGKNDKVFTHGVLGPTQAYLETFKYLFNDIPIADGFKEAADVIVDYLATGKHTGYPDRLFFPIAYLYRHSIELYLKSLMQDGIDLGILENDEKNEDLLVSHNLHKLWNKVRVVLEEFWSNGDPNTLIAAENIILQFHHLDESGQSFRYSRDKQSKSNLKEIPTHVDLAELKEVSGGLLSFLDACSMGLGEAKDWQGNY